MHGKTMREALNEVRSFRDTTNEGGPGSGPQKGGKKFSDKQIKQAYGILNDPRYKQGNYSGASKAIDKLAPGLSNHPDVKNAMKRANEEVQEGGPGSGPQKTNFKPLSKNHSSARATVSPSKAREIKKFLSDNGEKYPVAINDNGSGQITIDDDGEKGSSFAAGQAIAKKFGVKVMGEGNIHEVKEASFSKGQMDALVKGFGPLGGSERNKIKMDKVADILKKLPKDALMQLSKANLPMVSKVAKELMKEEIDEAVVGLPFSRTLMYIIKTDRNTATRIKSFLADNGEKYPIHVDDNGSGQITLDAYNYTGGEKKAALAAAQAIAKKFNVKVNATR